MPPSVSPPPDSRSSRPRPGSPAAAGRRKTCTIEGFTPGSVTLGLTPKEVKFAPKTSGCTVTSWSISTSSFQATNKNPYVTLRAKSAPAKIQDVVSR